MKLRYLVSALLGLTLLIIGGAVIYIFVSYSPQVSPLVSSSPSPSYPAISLYVSPELDTFSSTLQNYLTTQKYTLIVTNLPTAADISLTTDKQAENDLPIGDASVGTPVAKLGGEQIITPTKQPIGYLHIGPKSPLTSGASLLNILKSSTTSDKTWTLNALGDIIPGRTVYKITNERRDQTAPYTQTADYTKNADLTLANLECPFSDNIDHPTLGMAFSAPTTAVQGLTFAGIDAVNLANNHSYNEGAGPFGDTMDILDKSKIPYFGGGRNETAAHSPQIMTVKGVKIALLGYSSIVGSVEAGNDHSGMATLSMAPWGPFEEAPVQQMEADIKAAKAQADLVLVYFHWGTEYTHDANQDQRTVAHRAIDAGADLILGTHPHWVQGVEWYHGKLITYSLGNFVFDQDWSTETKQGTILSATFNGKNLVSASLKPYEIEGFYQPRFVDDKTGQKILGDVFEHSWWK